MPIRAYGLELQPSFPLPGIGWADADAPPTTGDRDLPTVALDRVAPDQLSAAWSGAGDAPAWTGELGDGRPLRIEHGVGGDVLFSYGRRARFRLDASAARLECAPREGGTPWLQVLLCRVLPDVAVLLGYEALHASAVESPHGVLAFVAAAGTGKSTLAVELVRRGWPLFADDVLVLGRGGHGGVRAYPGTPHLNLAEQACADFEPTAIAGEWRVLPGERWIALRDSASRARPVELVCVLEHPREGAATCERVASTPLALGPYMIGLSNAPERERERFALYADLTETAKLVRLCRGRSSSPSELANLIERALDAPDAAPDGRALAAGGMR